VGLSIQLALSTTGVFSLTVLAQKRQNLSPDVGALSRLSGVRRVDEDCQAHRRVLRALALRFCCNFRIGARRTALRYSSASTYVGPTMARGEVHRGVDSLARARTVRRAIASDALDGRTPSQDYRRDISLFVMGKIDEARLIRIFKRRIAR
jgi:hypothetical protein